MDVNNPLKMVLIGIDPYPYRGKLNTAADTGVPLLWNRFSSGCADPGIICARKDLWWRQLGDNIWEAQQINLPSGQRFGVLLLLLHLLKYRDLPSGKLT